MYAAFFNVRFSTRYAPENDKSTFSVIPACLESDYKKSDSRRTSFAEMISHL